MNRPLLSLLFPLAACSSGSASNNVGGAVAGSVAGSTFGVASARANLNGNNDATCPGSDGGSSSCVVGGVSIQLGSREEAVCASAATGASNTLEEFANTSELDFGLVKVGGPITAGTYDISPPPPELSTAQVSVAGFSRTTPTCTYGLNIAATSGTVTLSEVTTTRMAGTYSVTFGEQGAFTGSFDVPICVPTPATMGTGVPPTVVCL